jgi:DNA-directed RNA polymerase subunit H
MSTLAQIIPLKINSNQKNKIMLTNIVKMLTNRNFLDKSKLEDNIAKISGKISDDNTYSIKSDFSDDKFIVKFIFQKITAVNKASGIADFLASYDKHNKLVVVTDIAKKATKQIATSHPKTEVFKDMELMIDLMSHELSPEYYVLNEDERNDFEERYTLKKKHLPKMYHSDPAARYYAMKVGDICKIIRKSTMTSNTFTYRIIIPSPSK